MHKPSPAEYKLPPMIGGKIPTSVKKNQPKWKMRPRTKLCWFPGWDVDFKGRTSPPATSYSPETDRDYPKFRYSMGKNQRFRIPSSQAKVHY